MTLQMLTKISDFSNLLTQKADAEKTSTRHQLFKSKKLRYCLQQKITAFKTKMHFAQFSKECQLTKD